MAGKKAREGERIRPCRRCKEPVKFIKSTWSVLAQRRQGWHWVNEDGAHHRCRDFNSSTGRRAPSKAKGNHIEIWTDGACEPNPGPGAYGVHIIWTNGRVTEYDGFDAETTNQRMELLAPIVALEHVKKRRGRIIIYSDSNYVINGITDWIENWKVNGWRNKRKQPVANRSLWERLDAAASPFRSRLDWQWVRGHDAIPGNERADFLARQRLLSELRSDRSAFQAAMRGFSRHHDFDPGPYTVWGNEVEVT